MPQDNSIACRLHIRKRADLNNVRHGPWADTLLVVETMCTSYANMNKTSFSTLIPD
jgi:hypothetical protein